MNNTSDDTVANSATEQTDVPLAPIGTWIPLPKTLCHSFLNGKMCPKNPCRFFHGSGDALLAVRKRGHNAYSPRTFKTDRRSAQEFARERPLKECSPCSPTSTQAQSTERGRLINPSSPTASPTSQQASGQGVVPVYPSGLYPPPSNPSSVSGSFASWNGQAYQQRTSQTDQDFSTFPRNDLFPVTVPTGALGFSQSLGGSQSSSYAHSGRASASPITQLPPLDQMAQFSFPTPLQGFQPQLQFLPPPPVDNRYLPNNQIQEQQHQPQQQQQFMQPFNPNMVVYPPYPYPPYPYLPPGFPPGRGNQ